MYLRKIVLTSNTFDMDITMFGNNYLNKKEGFPHQRKPSTFKTLV